MEAKEIVNGLLLTDLLLQEGREREREVKKQAKASSLNKCLVSSLFAPAQIIHSGDVSMWIYSMAALSFQTAISRACFSSHCLFTKPIERSPSMLIVRWSTKTVKKKIARNRDSKYLSDLDLCLLCVPSETRKKTAISHEQRSLMRSIDSILRCKLI